MSRHHQFHTVGNLGAMVHRGEYRYPMATSCQRAGEAEYLPLDAARPRQAVRAYERDALECCSDSSWRHRSVSPSSSGADAADSI